jgi:hypothetical protein
MSGLFDSIRLSVFKHFVERKLNRNIEHHPVSLNKAVSIGILFCADDIEERTMVERYAQALKEQGKEVQLLAFLEKRDLQSDYLFPYITPKDATWFGKPKGGTAGYFIKYPFDMLINFSLREILPLEYIAALSHAAFRIGFNEKGLLAPYDCILLGDRGANSGRRIENIQKYLA